MIKTASVQKNIAIIVSISGFIVALSNFISYITTMTFVKAFLMSNVFSVLVLAAIFLITAFFKNEFFRILQVVIIFLTAAVSILDVYNSIHGLGLIVLAVFLSFKYGYFKRFLKIKIGLLMMAVYLLIFYSASLNNPRNIFTGLGSIIYLSMFLLVSYVIYRKEIESYILKNQSYKEDITKFKKQRDTLTVKLNKINAQLEELTRPIDLKEKGLTAREIEFVKTLVLYRETEQKIAERMGVSINGVKSHFVRIRRKLGVKRREQIIEICMNNF